MSYDLSQYNHTPVTTMTTKKSLSTLNMDEEIACAFYEEELKKNKKVYTKQVEKYMPKEDDTKKTLVKNDEGGWFSNFLKKFERRRIFSPILTTPLINTIPMQCEQHSSTV